MSPHAAPRTGRTRGNWIALGCIVVACAVVCAIGSLIGWASGGFDRARTPWPAVVAFGAVVALVGLVTIAVWWRGGGRARVRRALFLAPGVRTLAKRLDVPATKLRELRPVYREVRIAKRGGGERVLHVPDATTKALQRRILRSLLARVPSHEAAYGFERGRSIAHHAAQHVGRAIVLHFDVVDFFPSTRAERIERMYLRLGWSREAAAVLTRLTTHKGGLPQGAPTSPRLSNLVNRGLDRAVARSVGVLHGRYSRYADDITVSFPEDWHASVERTKARVKDELGRRGYRMHERKKLSVRRRHQRQQVCGLVVNDKVALPRDVRRRLRAVRHHLAAGRTATLTAEQVRGWDAFEKMVREQGAETPPPWVRKGPPSSARRGRRGPKPPPAAPGPTPQRRDS